jgi:hypothetical protein
MKTLWDRGVREELKNRIALLKPDAKARWGKMNARQMVVHLTSSMLMAQGEISPAPKNLPIRFTPLKQLIIYWLPFPKGAPTAPELKNGKTGEWNDDVARLVQQIEILATRDPSAPWPAHPAFGKLTQRTWGVLGYRHTDHHLKQFGV